MKFKITVDVDTDDKSAVSDIQETISVETEDTITVEELAGEAPTPAVTEKQDAADEDEFIGMAVTRRMSLKTMENMVRDKELKIGDQLIVDLDGNDTLFDVIGIDADAPKGGLSDHLTYVTIQSHDLLEAREFDEGGNNVWEKSSLRKYLESDVFISRFDQSFISHLARVEIDNNSGAKTEDMFFLLSKDDYDPIATCYPYYQNKRNQVKFAGDDETHWHWTRSAYRGGASYAWYVYSSGGIGYTSASNAYRFAPACVVIFES